MPSFKLINPIIIGEFRNTVEADNHLEAARDIWMGVSRYITQNLPMYAITVENLDDGKIYNFKIEEVKIGNETDYKICTDNKLSPEQLKEFKKLSNEVDSTASLAYQLSKENMKGGKRDRYKNFKYSAHDNVDDDDSSSTTSEDEKILKKYKILENIKKPQPIVFWWYNPLIYKIPYIFVPSVKAPLMPYIEINLSSAFL